MPTEHLARCVDDIARFIGTATVTLQKAQVIAVGHEADILAIVLLGVDEALCLGDFAHMALLYAAQRQKRMRQLVLRHGIQHVALVFFRIESAAKCPAAVPLLDSRVVPRSNMIAPEFFGALQQPAEFHAPIALDARVGRMARFVFLDERPHNLVFEFSGIIEHIMRNSQAKRHITRIFNIIEAATCMPRRINVFVVIELHGGADAFVALALQQIRRHARIDAAAHRNQHAPLGVWHVHPSCRFRPTVFGHRGGPKTLQM